MPKRVTHAGFDVYFGDTLTRRKAIFYHDRPSATIRIAGDADSPDAILLTEVEFVSNISGRRRHTITFNALNAEGEPVTVTGVKEGCGCGGSRPRS